MTIEEIKKGLEDNNLEPYGVNQLMSFINGNVSVTKKGNLKLSIELPSEVLKKKSVPFSIEDFNIVPLLLFCKHKESNLKESESNE